MINRKCKGSECNKHDHNDCQYSQKITIEPEHGKPVTMVLCNRK